MLKFFGYWRSSAAYRLRIALNLKGLAYEQVSINLKPDVSAHLTDDFRQMNPQMRVPVIETEHGIAGQSMAILEWLDETYPNPPLLPSDPWQRLQARAFADIIACDIHPLNNLSVLKTLKSDFGADQDAVSNWYADWIIKGFTAMEAQIADVTTPFLYGDTPGIAEICLVPQIYNARRFNVPLEAFPRLVDVDARCLELDAFQKAAPEAQADAS